MIGSTGAKPKFGLKQLCPSSAVHASTRTVRSAPTVNGDSLTCSGGRTRHDHSQVHPFPPQAQAPVVDP
jgi:hypothetical protein